MTALKAHPLLRFFHCVEIDSDDCWIRIPPGTLHAWQGGGNFLIELGHRSDNTFRILDYGRELSDDPRKMHYVEAMYSLNDNGFFDDQAGERLIVPLNPAKSPAEATETPCHALLGCRVYSIANHKTFSTESQGEWSFLMNPDGDMSLIANDENGFRCQMSVGRCRTVLIKSGVQVEVQPEQQDNRVLHFFRREATNPLLCLCLGGTRWYAGLWIDDEYPPIDWCLLDIPRKGGPKIGVLLKVALKNGGWQKIEKFDIGISWPGFIDRENKKLYSTLLGDWDQAVLLEGAPSQVKEQHPFLSDFQAALLGETRHPLGRLNPKSPGALINIGRGICLAFYLPGVEKTIFEDKRITVCSGVGRWLYVSLKTGELKRADNLFPMEFPEKTGGLQRLVFGSPQQTRFQEWVRASKYFSAAGIVVRSQLKATGALLDAYDRELVSLEKDSGPILHNILRAIERTLRPRDIADFARDLAGLVRQVEIVLEDQASMPGGTLHGEWFTKIKEECLRNIVLTGQVGQYFGVADTGGSEDLLVETMKQQLGKGYEVKRSEIGVAAEREAEGFVYYRSL